jgi:hypothetical protein
MMVIRWWRGKPKRAEDAMASSSCSGRPHRDPRAWPDPRRHPIMTTIALDFNAFCLNHRSLKEFDAKFKDTGNWPKLTFGHAHVHIWNSSNTNRPTDLKHEWDIWTKLPLFCDICASASTDDDTDN